DEKPWLESKLAGKLVLRLNCETKLCCLSAFQISERTESLNRSLKKSNSIKKMQPITNISKIDERLEQYTSAIESTTKSLRHTSLDMPNLPEDVATKKSLWESGDVAGYSVAKGTPCKDTDGLKVGVCDLINQWVSKNPESNPRSSPSKPAVS
ncbi:non-muscle caldesmon-like, partial [Rhincodon typus]|uniref:non-muscle caldesmon-like n=1 Tax=Rhincodon typus TaxID=259920 RepID=UPI00202ECA04